MPIGELDHLLRSDCFCNILFFDGAYFDAVCVRMAQFCVYGSIHSLSV